MICSECGDDNLDYNSLEICEHCAEQKKAEAKATIDEINNVMDWKE